jgi:hypothetical protein
VTGHLVQGGLVLVAVLCFATLGAGTVVAEDPSTGAEGPPSMMVNTAEGGMVANAGTVLDTYVGTAAEFSPTASNQASPSTRSGFTDRDSQTATADTGKEPFLVGTGAVAGQQQPGEPVNLYGTTEERDGTPAPEGTILFAIVDGDVQDNITVSPPGQYGGPGTFDNALTVNTGAGDEVVFRVFSTNGPQSIETFDLSDPGSGRQEFNLTFPDGTFTDEPTPPSFDVGITDVPAEVTAGDEIIVDYQVENTGGESGTQDIEFVVGGTVESTQTVTLDGGELSSDSFGYTTVTGDTPELTAEVRSEDDTDTATVSVDQSGSAPAFLDVSITDAPDTVPAGDTITVEYQVENTGGQSGTQGIEFVVDGTVESTQTVTLDGGELRSDNFSYTTVTGETPELTTEVRSENDTDTATVAVDQSGSAPAFFDVSITDAPNAVPAGDTITVEYRVENTGNESGTQDIEFVVDDGIEATQSGVELGVDESVSQSFSYTTESGDAPGVTVEVSSNDDAASNTVTVQSPERTVQSVSLAIAESSIQVGEITQATVTAEFDDGTTDDVSAQATIDAGGNSVSVDGTEITGETPGTVTVTAEFTDGDVTVSDTAAVTVEAAGSNPRELNESEIQQRFDVPEGQEPVRAEEANAVPGDDGAESTATFTEEGLVESVVIGQNTGAIVSVAEYVEQPSTAEPVPGASVATAQITVPEALQQTSGRVIKRISTDRLSELGADGDDLRIQRLVDGSPETLETEILSRENGVVRIAATTPGFSFPFFITSAVSAPAAEVALTPAEPVTGEELTLDGTGSTDQYGDIVSYQWSVNADGIEEQTRTGEQATVVLDEPGEYSVELTVENDAGETATQTTTVTVEQAAPTLTGVSIEVGQTTLTEGNSTEIAVTAEFDDGTTQGVTNEATIESGNTSVVTVGDGTLTAESAGSAAVTVQFEGESVTQPITVEQQDGDGEGDDSSGDGSGPGLGIVTALVAILLLTYVSRRRA